LNLTTKYGVGDVVYSVTPGYRDLAERECALCSGNGQVAIQGSDRTAECPDCRYGMISEWVDRDMAAHPHVIGQVRVETESKTDRGKKKVSYMCLDTGIGSGTVWAEDRLYATREEAEAAIETLADA